MRFHSNTHGKNVALSNNCKTARRTKSYDNGVVYSNRPLQLNEVFTVQIDEIDTYWGGGMVSYLHATPEK